MIGILQDEQDFLLAKDKKDLFLYFYSLYPVPQPYPVYHV